MKIHTWCGIIVSVIVILCHGTDATQHEYDNPDNLEQLVMKLASRVEDQTRLIQSLQQQIQSQDKRIVSLENQNKELRENSYTKNLVGIHDNPTDDISVLQKENRIRKDINKIRRAENEVPYAFFAAADSHISHLGEHQVLLFDNITTNVGNAYNEFLSTFIAPMDGIYVFSATIVSQNHYDGHADFVRNDQFISRMYVHGSESGFDSSSKMIVVQLNKGDTVNLRNVENNGAFQGDHHSSFSGFLLQETFPGSPIIGK